MRRSFCITIQKILIKAKFLHIVVTLGVGIAYVKGRLQAIKDHYPKVLLTMDEDPEVHYDGIRKVNARDWLLGLTD